MATDPQIAMQGQDQGAQQGSEDNDGYCIEIHVKADGTITVSVESEAAEQAEDQNAESESAMPVKSIKEALSMALDIFKSNGEMQQPGADMDQMNAGYTGQKAPKQPMQGGM